MHSVFCVSVVNNRNYKERKKWTFPWFIFLCITQLLWCSMWEVFVSKDKAVKLYTFQWCPMGSGLESSSGRVWLPGLIFDTSSLGCDTVRLFSLSHVDTLCGFRHGIWLELAGSRKQDDWEANKIKTVQCAKHHAFVFWHSTPWGNIKLRAIVHVCKWLWVFFKWFFIPKKPAWSYNT